LFGQVVGLNTVKLGEVILLVTVGELQIDPTAQTSGGIY